jgi:hypothetical protein
MFTKVLPIDPVDPKIAIFFFIINKFHQILKSNIQMEQ